MSERFQLAAAQRPSGQCRAPDGDADTRCLSGYASLLRHRLGGGHYAARDQPPSALVIAREEERRGFFRLTATALLFTMGGVIFALAALCVMIVVPIALDRLGFSGGGERLFAILRWPILYVAIAAALAVIYRYGPSREGPQWRRVSWGSAIAALLWLVVSILFAWYAAHFGSCNKTYGSLGAVIGFMTWIWLSALVVLLGAELDAEMEHQTARDTTTGLPRPLGRRGAQAADTIDPAKR